jgi:hypothetical protein
LLLPGGDVDITVRSGPIEFNPLRETWVPCYDPTDKDPALKFEDLSELTYECSSYDQKAAASIDIEGIGGGSVSAGETAILIDFIATSAKRDANGVGKKYGFTVRVVVNVKSASADAHSNITGLVASVEAGSTQAKVKVHALGLSGDAVLPTPSLTKLDIGEYAQLFAYKSKIESLIKLKGEGGVKLNAVLLGRTVEKPAAPPVDDVALLGNSYTLLAVRGIKEGKSQADWSKYINSSKVALRDKNLFQQAITSVYDSFGVASGALPNASQKALALEKTDGVYAARMGFE